MAHPDMPSRVLGGLPAWQGEVQPGSACWTCLPSPSPTSFGHHHHRPRQQGLRTHQLQPPPTLEVSQFSPRPNRPHWGLSHYPEYRKWGSRSHRLFLGAVVHPLHPSKAKPSTVSGVAEKFNMVHQKNCQEQTAEAWADLRRQSTKPLPTSSPHTLTQNVRRAKVR